MRAAAFETVLPNDPITSLPIALHQSAARVSPLLVLTFALSITAAALAPFWLIAQHADGAMLLDRPETTIPLAFAFVTWMVLFGWPLAIRARRMGQRRTIDITPHRVTVADTGWLTKSTWVEPLSGYIGMAHHVRASRHELILVHPNPARSLLMRVDTVIHQREIDTLTRLLGCREIAPQIFYRKPAAPMKHGLNTHAKLTAAN